MKQLTAFDTIYANLQEISPFKFDEKVVNVFPDMINRSVPGYALTIPLIGLLADRYAQTDSRCYDLGCSLGAATLSMRHQITVPGCRLVAVDSSRAMIRRFREILAEDEGKVPVEVIEADIRACEIRQASVVVLNFTLQFISPAERDRLIARIYDGLLPGGALILSEKVIFDEPQQNQRFIDIHHAYKRANGYSDLEISQKRTALENVLVPETIETHQNRLFAAGFEAAEVWFQAFNFAALLALK